MSYIENLLARLREPSTWAGIAVIAGMFGNHVAPDTIVHGGMALAGVASMLLPEQGGK